MEDLGTSLMAGRPAPPRRWGPACLQSNAQCWSKRTMLKPVIKDHNTQLGLVSGHSVQTLTRSTHTATGDSGACCINQGSSPVCLQSWASETQRNSEPRRPYPLLRTPTVDEPKSFLVDVQSQSLFCHCHPVRHCQPQVGSGPE